MATGGVTDQVGGRRGHLCDPCNRAGRRTLATVLCKTCDGHLCTDCCVKHLASAIGQHKIFNIGEQNEEEVTADDVQHSSDFVDTIRNTRDITRSATLKHLVTLDLVKTDGDDELPFVTGMDFLPDGRLVAVDYRNKRCIVLDDNLRRKGLHTFETVPLDLTCYGGDKLAVTCSNRTIALLSMSKSNKISLVRTLRTSFFCFSISPMNDNKFLLSTFDHPRAVCTITVQGQEGDVQHAGLPDKTYKVNESRCTYVAPHKSIVFTDRYAQTVYIYNIESGRCQTVQSDKIKKPCGTCPGNYGTVFVCSKDTNTLVHLSLGGEILMSHDVGMAFPLAVCISPDGSRVAVSNCAEGQKMIKVFQVSS